MVVSEALVTIRNVPFLIGLYTPLSNLGPAQLESRAIHECAEALPVRDPAGPTRLHTGRSEIDLSECVLPPTGSGAPGPGPPKIKTFPIFGCYMVVTVVT